jgi:hypothetical protein
MDQFDILYEKIKVFKKNEKLTKRQEETLDLFLEEFQKALSGYHKEVDRSNVNSCLEAISLLKNFHWHNIVKKDGHILAFLDFYTPEELSILFNVKLITVRAKIQNIQRARKSTTLSDIELPIDIESIKKMTDEEFSNLASAQARLTVIKALSTSNVTQFSIEMAKQILIGERDQRVKELDKMWQLCKDWLAWWTGECIPKLVKKITQSRPPFDAKVLAAEVADEKYTELVRKYQEVKPRVETPLDEMVKKAKRRGKWKEVRKREEKEAKLLKASSSSAPTGDGESLETSVNEKTVS